MYKNIFSLLHVFLTPCMAKFWHPTVQVLTINELRADVGA